MSTGFQFTQAAEKCIVAAQNLARENSNINVVPAHLAAALLDDASESSTSSSLFASVLEKAGADLSAIRRGIQKIVVRLPSQDPPPDDISFNGPAMKVLREAQKASKDGGDTFIGNIHLIMPLVQDSQLASVFKEAGAAEQSIRTAVQTVRAGKKVDSKQAEEGFEALKKYGLNLTALAAEGNQDPVIGRNDEIRRIIRILSRRTKNNPVIIGEAGVGKTACVEGLAQRIVSRDVPVNLIGAQIWSLDMGALTAGASYKGQFEERLKSVIEECEKSENVILFIDEIHLIMAGQGSSNSGLDAANLLKPSLARGKLRVIGATTLAEYRKYIEKDQAMVRRFQEVQAAEPDVPSAISILRGIKEKYELHHGVTISDAALVSAVTLAHRYLTSRKLPDSAIDLIDEAASSVRVARDSQPEIIDRLTREKMELEVAVHALEKEKKKAGKLYDTASTERLETAQAGIRAINDQLEPLIAEYESLKHRTNEINDVREKIDQMKSKAEKAERNYDLATASDIRYGAIPNLQEKLAELEKRKAAEDANKANGNSLLGEEEVTPDAVAEIVSRWTGIPANSLKQSEKSKLIHMEKLLSKEVVGQKEAVSAVANAIRLSRSGLSNENRPTASFLFSGASGTGKTQLVKALASHLFNDPSAICRIDCSEYSESHSVSRLIGAPPGYVGYEAGGVLTEYVRRKPYSIVLVDELEKAHRALSLLFLQILDEGHCMDSLGQRVNFKNTIIVFTTNTGSQYINELPPDAKLDAVTKEKVQEAVRRANPPEFLNRLDAIVVFNSLGRDQLHKIISIRLLEIQKRMQANGRKITLKVSDDAKQWIAQNGYHPAYGARPLNRVIQKEILDPLARYILEERVLDGEVAEVDADFRANRLVVKANHESTINDDGDVDMDDDIDIDDVRVEELD